MLPELLRHSDRTDVLSHISEELQSAHRPLASSSLPVSRPAPPAAPTPPPAANDLWDADFVEEEADINLECDDINLLAQAGF